MTASRRPTHDSLAGIFGDVAWGNKERLPEPSLLNLIDAFDRLTLNRTVVPNDMLGAAYEYLLREFADASGKKAGEFFTPRGVVRLLVGILAPRPGETVYDPACGSGGMLVETINEVRESGGDTRTLRLYGQEINLTTAAIARMNLFLHDLEDFRIVRGDTLRDPRFLLRSGLRKFDVVVANPPFSLKNWGADTWAGDPYGRAVCGVPPTNTGDLAWVQHMVASMTPGTGRVGVVMPKGVLFRGGSEKAIRRCLVEQDQLEAVIGLPPNLFYSTTIPACLLIFRATKPAERQGHILFVDGSARFVKGRKQNQMSEPDIEAVLAAYRGGDVGDVGVALVDHGQIKDTGWDLNVSRYVKGTVAEAVTVEAALEQLAAAQTSLHEAEARLAARLKPPAMREVALRELMSLDLERVTVDPSRRYKLAGVYSFGRGLFAREDMRGSETSYEVPPRPAARPIRDEQVEGLGGRGQCRARGFRRIRPVTGVSDVQAQSRGRGARVSASAHDVERVLGAAGQRSRGG